MRLAEEYTRRHHLKGIPLVEHCHYTSLILQATNPARWGSRWLVLYVRWVEDLYHPGRYAIRLCRPNHDGFVKNNLFEPLKEVECWWDQYEQFLLDWLEDLHDVKPIRGQKEITLSAWEIFLFCYDGWFVYQPGHVKEKVYRSIDEELSLQERYIGYQDVLIYLTLHNSDILKAWKCDVLSGFQNYAEWLARLVEKQCTVPSG
jgi:hypothetical protein